MQPQDWWGHGKEKGGEWLGKKQYFFGISERINGGN